MKTFNHLFVLIIGMMLVHSLSSQVSTPSNSGAAGNYVGWDAFQAFPLQIRHNANQPINFFTNNAFRVRLNHNVTSGTTVAAGLVNKTGFLGINTNDPWARLHIVGGNYGLCGGYRPWMTNGMLVQLLRS